VWSARSTATQINSRRPQAGEIKGHTSG
jgi:hypothetical protein